MFFFSFKEPFFHGYIGLLGFSIVVLSEILLYFREATDCFTILKERVLVPRYFPFPVMVTWAVPTFLLFR